MWPQICLLYNCVILKLMPQSSSVGIKIVSFKCPQTSYVFARMQLTDSLFIMCSQLPSRIMMMIFFSSSSSLARERERERKGTKNHPSNHFHFSSSTHSQVFSTSSSSAKSYSKSLSSLSSYFYHLKITQILVIIHKLTSVSEQLS